MRLGPREKCKDRRASGSAPAAVIGASPLGRRPLTALSGTALAANLVARLSGSASVGQQKAGASLAMALAGVRAMLCDAVVIFILRPEHVRSWASHSEKPVIRYCFTVCADCLNQTGRASPRADTGAEG